MIKIEDYLHLHNFSTLFSLIELGYANMLHKKMVPIRLQPKFRPSGWLGFIIGGTFYFDLFKAQEYESKMADMIKEIGNDAKIKPGECE